MSVHAVLARPRAERFATAARAVDFGVSLRLGLLAACLVLAVIARELPRTWPWLLLLALLAALPAGRWQHDRFGLGWSVVEMVLAWGGILVLSAAQPNPLLVYLVAPALGVALHGGRRAVLWLGLACAAAPLAVAPLAPGVVDGQVCVQAWALSMSATVLGLWARSARQEARSDAELDQYEAQRLLAEVHALARRLPGGFDVGSVAGALAERLTVLHPVDRVAVLAGHAPDALTPVALHGWRQLPPLPAEVDGHLGRAWATGTCQLRTVGSDLVVVVPLRVGDGLGVGAVVLGWVGPAPTPAQQRQLLRDCAPSALQLETAQLFDEVRLAGLVEARESLAAQMHNGIAQDLASVGFELDLLKSATRGTAVHEDVAAVRSHVTELVQDLRLSISDLRSTIGPGQGLSGALSSQVRHVAGTRDVPVSLDLRESGLRLAAPVEQLLYRVAILGAQVARHEPGVEELHVALATDPPAATLSVRVTGRGLREPALEDDLAEIASALAEHSGVVSVQVHGDRAITLCVTVGGGTA